VEGTKKKVGTIKTSDFARLREICQSISVPGKLILSKTTKKNYNVYLSQNF
jgi:hypothetical protein